MFKRHFNWMYILILILIWVKKSFETENNWKIQLQSPRITDFGDWGIWEMCPVDKYVTSLQVKVERGSHGDHTGLNGVNMYCNKIGEHFAKNGISSKIGQYGEWGSVVHCDGLGVGYQLRSLSYQGHPDDIAADNLRLYCSEGNYVEGVGNEWGKWTSIQKCPTGQAICGIKTQIDNSYKSSANFFGIPMSGDNTGLNNINARCCNIRIPVEICVAKSSWTKIFERDNTKSAIDVLETIRTSIGLGEIAGKTSGRNDKISAGSEGQVSSKLSLPGIGEIAAQFKSQISGEMSKYWKNVDERTWNKITDYEQQFNLRAGLNFLAFQLVGECDKFVFRSSIIKYCHTEIDECLKENEKEPENLDPIPSDPDISNDKFNNDLIIFSVLSVSVLLFIIIIIIIILAVLYFKRKKARDTKGSEEPVTENPSGPGGHFALSEAKFTFDPPSIASMFPLGNQNFGNSKVEFSTIQNRVGGSNFNKSEFFQEGFNQTFRSS